MYTPDENAQPVSRGRIVVALACIVSLAFLLRLHGLASLSVYWEEYVLLAGAGEFESFSYYTAPVNLISGMYLPTIIWAFFEWSNHISASAAGMRGMNVLLGLITLLGVFGLGRRLFGPREGLLAALLFALSAVHLWWDQALLPYTAPATAAVGSLYFFARWQLEGSRIALLLHLLLANLLLSLHLTTNMYLVPLGIIVLFRSYPNLRPLLLWLAGFLPAWLYCLWWVLPNANYFIDYNDYFAPSFSAIALHLIGQDVIDYIIEYVPILALDGWPRFAQILVGMRPLANAGLALLVLLLLGLGTVHAFRRFGARLAAWRGRETFPWLLLYLFLFLPYLEIYLLSSLIRPVYANRFMQPVTCIAYVLLAAILFRIPVRPVRRVLIGALCILMAYQIVLLKSSVTRPEIAEAARHLAQQQGDDDLTLVIGDNAAYGKLMFDKLAGAVGSGPVETAITPGDAAFKARRWVEDQAEAKVWLVVVNPTDPSEQALKEELAPQRVDVVQLHDFSGKLVRLFSMRPQQGGARLAPDARPDTGINPFTDLPNAMYVCWYALYQAECGYVEEAYATAQHALSMQPALPYTHFVLGVLQGLLGKHELASASFLHAFEADYRTLTIYEPLVRAMYEEHDPELLRQEIQILKGCWFVAPPVLQLAEMRLREGSVKHGED